MVKERYKDAPPPLRTIGQIMKDLGAFDASKKEKEKELLSFYITLKKRFTVGIWDNE